MSYPEKSDRNLAVTVINPNITPSSTKHSEQIRNATETDKNRLKKPASLKERKKLAAAYNLSTTPENMTKHKLNLYSEQRFIEEYKQKGIQVYTELEDPYNDAEKDMLHENWRREGATRRASEFRAQFVLGERTHIVMDVNRGYANKEREDAALKEMNDNEEYNLILDEVATIDINVNLFDRLNDLLVTANNFGRSVMVIQRDADGIPIELIPLWSLRLGKVYVDASNHNFLGVEYKDYEGEERILKAEDIIYYTVDDYAITPNSRHFGLAPAETTMATAHSIRVSTEIAVNEIVKKMWANTRIIKAPGIKSQATLDRFIATLLPGKDIGTNLADLTIETIQNDPKLNELIDSISEREKMIFRNQTVPLVVGFQDEQNRATAQYALHQWTVSVLKDARTDLRNIIEDQWYKPTLRALLKKRANLPPEESTEQPESESPETPETESPMQSQDLESQLPNVPVDLEQQTVSVPQSPIDPNNPPFKIRMTFDDIIFDTFLEKSTAALGFLQAGAITKEICLKIAGIDERYIEEMMQIWAEQEEAKRLKQEQGMVTPVVAPTEGAPAPGETTPAVIPSLPIATTQAGGSSLKPKRKGTKKK